MCCLNMMPVCAYISDYNLKASGPLVRAEVLQEGGVEGRLTRIVQEAFPESIVSKREFEITKQTIVWESREVFDVLSSDSEMQGRLDSFLDLLGRCITIADDLDESHALSPHMLPPDDGDEANQWKRTRTGELVNQAKDYQASNVFKDGEATSSISAQVMEFLSTHPQYLRAGIVVPAPSSNPAIGRNLPWAIAREVTLEKRLVAPRRLRLIPPQKGYNEAESGVSREELQEGTVQVDEALSGTVVVIDDLYESGGTLMEVARACRKAGANSVLGLTITKNAKQTQGMDIASWPWG